MNTVCSHVFRSVAQWCPTICDPMDCSTPGFPDHHQLLKLTHVHWVSDDIQPSHPLSSPSPPTFNLFKHQGLFKWVLHIRWPKYWSFSFSISPSNEYSVQISFRIDWLDLLAVQGLSWVFSNTTVQKHQFFGAQLSLGDFLVLITYFVLLVYFCGSQIQKLKRARQGVLATPAELNQR